MNTNYEESRKMPFNNDAEMSVLGVLFISPYEIERVCDIVNEDMFFNEKNKIIFKAIKNLNENHNPVNISTLKNELDKTKSLNMVGLDYISEVISSVVTTANIDYYIGIMTDCATRRNLISACTDIIKKSYNTEEELSSLQASAEKSILYAVRNRSVGALLSIYDAIRVAHEKLEELAKNKKVITGLETGFYDLDKITTGFQPGEMIIVAARPGMGKTAFVLNMAANAALSYLKAGSKKAIAIFNLEMPADMIVNRMITARGRIEQYKIQTGNMSENDWQRYNEAITDFADTNIFIETDTSATISEIRAKCRRLASSEGGLGLVVIDYLQLINSGSKRTESRQVEVSEISRSIKTMALELGVPVIACCQLSRAAEKRESNVPMLADLRESGSLEQDADMVLFINRKDYYEAKKDQRETNVDAQVIIAKHRKGSLGTIDLKFNLSIGAFNSVPREYKKESE